MRKDRGQRSIVARALTVTLLSAMVVTGAASPAASASVVPVPTAGPECNDNGGPWTMLKVEPVSNGTFVRGDLEVTVFGYDGKSFSWFSNLGVDAVLVKGDEDNKRHGYFYDPEATADTAMNAPLKGGVLQKIENARWCFDLDDVEPLANPPYPNTCGLDIALLIDVSGSINDEELAFEKQAAKDFVDAVAGTGSRMSVTSFDADATQVLSFTPVDDPGGAQAIKNAIDSVDGTGNTNWDAAFRLNDPDSYPVEQASLAVLVTDGHPTTWGIPNAGRSEADGLRAGIRSANGLKEDGTRIVGVGVAFDRPVFIDELKAVSGPVEGEDYFLAADFADLSATLGEVAADACRSLFTPVKVATPTEVDLTDGDTSNDVVTYQLTVTNDGNEAGTSPEITDTFDGDHAFVVDAGGGTVSGNTISFGTVTLDPGQSAVFTYQLRIVGPFAPEAPRCEGSEAFSVLNQVVVGDETTSAEVCVTDGRGDLDVAKSASDQTVEHGASVTYTITVTNTGSASAAAGAEIVDDYDQDHLDITDTGGGVDDGDTITFTTGAPLDPGASVSFIYTGTIIGSFSEADLDPEACPESPYDFPVTNQVTITGDGSTADETVCVSVPGSPGGVSKFANPSTGVPGEIIEFTVSMVNGGPGPLAAGAEAVDDYDEAHLEIVDTGGGVNDGQTLTFTTTEALDPGEGETFTYTGRLIGTFDQDDADPETCGEPPFVFPVINSVTFGDRTASTFVCVDARPDLSARKEARNVTDDGAFVPTVQADPGDTIEYRITVRNDGAAEATGVTVTDTVPARATFVSCDSCTELAGVLTWQIGSLAGGGTASVTYIVTLDGAFGYGINVVDNTASFDSDQTPPGSSNEVLVVVTVFVKSACPIETVVPGGVLTYELPWGVDTNDGSALTGVTVEDRLPPEVELIAANPAPTASDGDTLTWALDQQPDGASGLITVTVLVPEATPLDTLIVNEADLFSDIAPRTTSAVSVLVDLGRGAHDERAFGVRVVLNGNPVLGPTPDTDPANAPDELLALPAPPAIEARLLSVTENGSLDATAAHSSAIATAAEVRVLNQAGNWLVTADAVRAVSSSFADKSSAGSSTVGSVLTNVTVAGQNLGTVTEPTTITLTDPVLNTTTKVHLLEHIESGVAAGEIQPTDGTFNSGVTVNAIHVVVKNAGGHTLADVVVSHADSSATFESGLACGDGVPHVSGLGYALGTTADETIVDPDTVLHDGMVARVLLPSQGGDELSSLLHVGPLMSGTTTLVESNAAWSHTTGAVDADADTAAAFTESQIEDLDLLQTSPGQFAIVADLVRAEVSASASGAPSASASGSTTIANLVIGGTDVCAALSLQSTCTPPPNTVLPNATTMLVILNEQIAGPSGPAVADLTVNAIHIYILGKGNPFNLPVGAEIIVSNAHADARASGAQPSQGGLPTTG